MSNYQQTTVAGESWVRAYSINIGNPIEGDKTIHFQEERAIVIESGEALTKRVGEVSDKLNADTIGTEFPLLNPETGEQVGTATYGQVYAMLHSAYMFLAKRRDDALIPPAPAPEPEPTYPID